VRNDVRTRSDSDAHVRGRFHVRRDAQTAAMRSAHDRRDECGIQPLVIDRVRAFFLFFEPLSVKQEDLNDIRLAADDGGPFTLQVSFVIDYKIDITLGRVTFEQLLPVLPQLVPGDMVGCDLG
jgi:hypothetical protein